MTDPKVEQPDLIEALNTALAKAMQAARDRQAEAAST